MYTLLFLHIFYELRLKFCGVEYYMESVVSKRSVEIGKTLSKILYGITKDFVVAVNKI